MMKKTKSRRLKAGLCALIIPFLLLGDPVGIYAGTAYTGSLSDYVVPNIKRVLDSDHTVVEKGVTMHVEAQASGFIHTTWSEWRIKPYLAEKIWFGEPQVIGCENCKQLESTKYRASVRIFLEDDLGNEYLSSNRNVIKEEKLQSAGLTFDNPDATTRVGLEIVQKTNPTCEVCGRPIGSLMTVDNLYWQIRTLLFNSQPQSVTVTSGQGATFEFVLGRYIDADGNPLSYYRWQRNLGDSWEYISDGTGSFGERYSGCTGTKLNIQNISSQMRGMKLRCELRDGVNGYVYTDTVSINMPAPTEPPVTPTNPPSTPTNPPPTVTPVVTPAPVPITPSPGSGRTDYTPSASSSSYVPKPGSSSSAGGGKSSSSSSSAASKGNSSYSGTITEKGGSSESSIIPAADPYGGGGSSGKGSSSVKKPTSADGRQGKNTSGSSSSSSKKTGSGNYVMKNGVLYVIDDDDPAVSAAGDTANENRVETEETELPYEASDLAAVGQIKEQEKDTGFFHTLPGYITIALISLLVLLLLLFFLFFGVIVFGEVEEHDEVFEICAIRLMWRRNGNWSVRLGDAFDDNAVLKLRIGLLFALIFEEWDITGQVTGSYEGVITGQVEQGMMLYRRNIRRTV